MPGAVCRELDFRLADSADWPGIWPVFRDVTASGETYAYPPGIAEASARVAWMLDPSGRQGTHVAEENGQIVATAYLKPNQSGLGDHVANAGWMVDPRSSGRGIGRAFAEYVIEEARRLRFTAMQFNAVVATNTHAIALWESLGFETVGRVPRAFRHTRLGPTDTLIMYREL